MKEASLLYCLPENPFFLPKALGSHAVQEATYACEWSLPTFWRDDILIRDHAIRIDCGWIFAQHFCNRLGSAYLQLKNILNHETDPAHAEVCGWAWRKNMILTITITITKLISLGPEQHQTSFQRRNVHQREYWGCYQSSPGAYKVALCQFRDGALSE